MGPAQIQIPLRLIDLLFVSPNTDPSEDEYDELHVKDPGPRERPRAHTGRDPAWRDHAEVWQRAG